MLGGNLGSLLYGDVSVMISQNTLTDLKGQKENINHTMDDKCLIEIWPFENLPFKTCQQDTGI